mmetsp:Transcript_44780/g.78160  ORF Transcript_44780/g.78160 Transcript_44780/m.78160 type:complete len:243 (+) Transcript_44780:896-1624(+)
MIFFALVAHLVFLRLFNFGHFHHTVNSHSGAVDLDLVRVHRRVGDHNLRIFDATGLAHTETLVQHETFLQEGILQTLSGLLDDLDVVKIAGTLESEHGVHGELGEVILLHVQQLGRQSGAGNVHQVLLELRLVRRVVHSGLLEGVAGNRHGGSPAGNDGHGVDALVHEELCLSQQLTTQHRHTGGAVADCVILNSSNIYKHLGSRVFNRHTSKDRGTIVGNSDTHVVRVTHRLQYFIHALRA